MAMNMATRRRTRPAWLGAITVASLSIAACGGGDDSTETTTAGTSAPSTAPSDTSDTSDTTSPAQEFEPTTLVLWSSFSDQESIDAFQPIIDRCQTDLPWLTIEYVGKDEMETALPAAIEAGSPPDLVQLDASSSLAAIAAGELVTPLDDLAARDGFDWDAFVPGGLQLVEFNGVRYGLPLSLDSAALFVNEDALAEVGIAKPPSTQAELLDAAKKLLVVNGDGSIDRIGFVPDVGDGSWGIGIATFFGATLINDDGTKITISDSLDQWVAALQWQRQFYELFDDAEFQRWADGLGSYDSAENFFIKGQLPLYYESSYFVTWPDRFGNGKPDNWTVVPFPGPTGIADANTQSFIASGNSFMIPTGVGDVEASWAALQCLATASPEIASFETVVGNIPANKAALDIFETDEVAKIPAYQTFIDLARSPVAELPNTSVVSGALRDELTTVILRYRSGDMTDDELRSELSDLEARYQNELDLELGG